MIFSQVSVLILMAVCPNRRSHWYDWRKISAQASRPERGARSDQGQKIVASPQEMRIAWCRSRPDFSSRDGRWHGPKRSTCYADPTLFRGYRVYAVKSVNCHTTVNWCLLLLNNLNYLLK